MFVDSFWCYIVIGFLVCLLMVFAFALVYVFVVVVQSSSRSSYLRAWGSYGVVLFKFPSFFIVAVWHWAGDFCQGLGSTVLSFETVWLSRRLVCGRWPIFIVSPSKGTITVSDRRLCFSCMLVSFAFKPRAFYAAKAFQFCTTCFCLWSFWLLCISYFVYFSVDFLNLHSCSINKILCSMCKIHCLYCDFFLVWFLG